MFRNRPTHTGQLNFDKDRKAMKYIYRKDSLFNK